MKNLNHTLKSQRLPQISQEKLNLISHYNIKQTIGKGGFAQVKKATHVLTKEDVAVKIIDKQCLSAQGIRRVRNQINIHSKMIHQNIIRIYQVQQTSKTFYIFMQYCPKGDIFDYLYKYGKLSQEEAGRIFVQITSALLYLHQQGITHRDIKLENILFDSNMNAKIADFGFTKSYKRKDGQDIMLTTFCGSPSYTPPQIVEKQKYNAELVDVWSLGVTLYALLAAQLPFGATPGDQLKQKIKQCNFAMKNYFSYDVQILLLCIFKYSHSRINLKDITKSKFYLRYESEWTANFINTEKESPYIDLQILNEIQEDYQIAREVIKDSVLNFKLTSYHALYYLTAKKNAKKGKNNQTDLDSLAFRKKSKECFSRIGNHIQDRYDDPILKRKNSLSLIKSLKSTNLQGKSPIVQTRKSVEPRTPNGRLTSLKKSEQKNRHQKYFLGQSEYDKTQATLKKETQNLTTNQSKNSINLVQFESLDKSQLKFRVRNRRITTNVQTSRLGKINESPQSPRRMSGYLQDIDNKSKTPFDC